MENATHIFENIRTHAFPITVFLRDRTRSTNVDAKNMLLGGEPPPFIVLAKSQSAAYGRLGMAWEGDAIGNLYASFALELTDKLERNMAMFTRHVAAEICESLAKRFSVVAAVKWPNDICVGEEKICGLLLEVSRSGGGVMSAVLGVGLNILSAPALENAPYAAACLQDFSRKKLDFDVEATAVILVIVAAIGRFDGTANEKIREKWNAFDAMLGKDVEVFDSNWVVRGRCLGIGGRGELLVEQCGGTVAGVSGGHAKIMQSGGV
ncbi:MAG: biotin--[acetyl-CoA-carboxylase] ligase [Puniceicoccales bacterium]|nr:biotin--[acetyl-CoA-carboxylase] ligase [Puniceicoccales bacterium]